MCELYSDNDFLTEWPNFKRNIYENPVHTLNCFKLAMHQVILTTNNFKVHLYPLNKYVILFYFQKILNTIPPQNLSFLNIINTLSTVRLKVLNYEPLISLQDLKASLYGMYLYNILQKKFFKT